MKLSTITLVAVATLGLSACSGTTNVKSAEEQCAADADLSDGFRGEARAGVGTNGPSGGLRLTVTNRVFNPQSPEDFYDNCVFQKSGQGPTRTLASVRR
ncbi:MAG: hypothetical protein ACI9KS_002670 [Sulfitobacter sp.]|jgi:hypothetical protein